MLSRTKQKNLAGSAPSFSPTISAISSPPSFFQDRKYPKIAAVYNDLSPCDFVSISHIDIETNQNFHLLEPVYRSAPLPFNGDLFTTVYRKNISDSLFDDERKDLVLISYLQHIRPRHIRPHLHTSKNNHSSHPPTASTPPLAPSSLFVKIPRHEASIKAATKVGGLPFAEPVQIASGTRRC